MCVERGGVQQRVCFYTVIGGVTLLPKCLLLAVVLWATCLLLG
jgi:hypothetical protein